MARHLSTARSDKWSILLYFEESQQQFNQNCHLKDVLLSAGFGKKASK